MGTDPILYLNVSSSLASVCVLALLFLLSSLSLHSPTLEVPTNMALLDPGAAVVAVLFVTVVLLLGSSYVRESLDSSLQRFSWYLAFRKSVTRLQDLNGRVLEQRWRYLALAIGKAFCFYAIDILILGTCILALGASVSLPLLVVA